MPSRENSWHNVAREEYPIIDFQTIQDGLEDIASFEVHFGLFTNDVVSLFVSSQSEEDGLRNLVVAGPLGKLDRGDQNRIDPNRTASLLPA
jgi:hypothetical protein